MSADAGEIVAVGMSGGVDSSVAASLLLESGLRVVGVTARLWGHEDVAGARAVARRLGVEHREVDLREAFRERVVERFLDEYASGCTPSPCVVCNEAIKFGALLDWASAEGCARVATGHYARIEERAGMWHLLRGADAQKEQSYFLHRLGQGALSRTLFPLGEWTKERSRTYAREKGFAGELRMESQDLCFVPDGDYAGFIERERPGVERPGPIVDEASGRVLGRHGGLHRYTVGQRDGLGVAVGERRYVKELDGAANALRIAPREGVMSAGCVVREVAWVADAAPELPRTCSVRLRYRHEGAVSSVRMMHDGSLCVMFSKPQFAVTPGQAAVFYDGDEVLGGGWIDGRIDQRD